MSAPRLSAIYELERGTVLGKYEILRKLATGGMAEIYLARTRGAAGFEKLVVLKRILPNVAEDPAFVQMFLDEARIAATLQHPNIADVYDVGEVDGTYFFTMEFVHGEDARALRHATKRRNERPPLAAALAIVHGTAAALDYAHEKTGPEGPLGLVHRDISSSNILISYDGAVKLVDFGIARATVSQSKTRTGTLKGKIPYMSPEQCRVQPLDRRSDLFSLGVVLFELTVGRRPFRGEGDFELMDAIVNHDAPRPSMIDPEYPRQLEAIVMKLLQRDREKRYRSADGLLHDLEELIAAKRLWMSSKQLGRYMRTLFADKIAAWERAEQDGVTLGQYVAQTITAQSHSSEIVTPPSAMRAVERPRATAVPPFADVQLSGAMRAVQPEPDAPSIVVEHPSVRTADVSLRPRRRGMVIAMSAVCTIAIGAAVLLVTRDSGKRRSASAPAAPSAPPVVETETEPPVGETEAPVVETKPRVAPVEEAAVKATPEPVPAKQVEPPAKTTKKAPKKPVKNPKRSPKRKPGTQPDKEPTWDPNSPFLPPS